MAFTTSRLELKSKYSPNEIGELTFLLRLDKILKEKGITSDELVEISGCSGTGKTYFCLKIVTHALLQHDAAVIYVDTTNYLNIENLTLAIHVSSSAAELF